MATWVCAAAVAAACATPWVRRRFARAYRALPDMRRKRNGGAL